MYMRQLSLIDIAINYPSGILIETNHIKSTGKYRSSIYLSAKNNFLGTNRLLFSHSEWGIEFDTKGDAVNSMIDIIKECILIHNKQLKTNSNYKKFIESIN